MRQFKLPLPFTKPALPVRYCEPFNDDYGQEIIKTFGLKRSGQHLVIEWISRGLVNVIHLNHCRFFRSGFSYVLTPFAGRRVIYSDGIVNDSGIQGRDNLNSSLPSEPYQNLLYSIEDISLNDPMIQKLDESFSAKTILILRDPANWLASSLQRKKSSKQYLLKTRDILIEYLEQATLVKSYTRGQCIAINYNKFIVDRRYREQLAQRLGLVSFENAEQAMKHTPSFGGGSSFKENSQNNNTLERWKHFQDDSFFRRTLNNKRLIDLSIEFFGMFPGLNEMKLNNPEILIGKKA